jgi:hypothetical protein
VVPTRARRDRARSAPTLVALVVGVALLAGACVGSGKTPRADSIEPLPDGMTIVADTADGCRDGESGFDYRFVVVGPADTTASGAFLTNLRDRQFVRTTMVDDSDGRTTDDLPWAEMGFQHREFPLRAEVGRLDRYLDDPRPHTGPPVDAIPEDVRADAKRYLLVALRPSDFQCHTPL